MGRVKKYAVQFKNKKHRSASLAKRIGKSDTDMDGVEESEGQQKTQGNLSIAKKRQIFKKSKDGRRDVKKRIAELKMQTRKLRKRNLDDKGEKKQISHEIKALKVSSYKKPT